MNLIKCPDEQVSYTGRESFFLCGSIIGEEWRDQIVESLKNFDVDIYNPKRLSWKEALEKDQVIWENSYLGRSNVIVFWFSEESVCPISLFELGVHLFSNKVLYVGFSPKYQKLINLQTQLKLINPNMILYNSLENLISSIQKDFEHLRLNNL